MQDSWSVAVVDLSPCHLMVKCLSPGITTGTRREKKCILARSSSRVVEHLPYHPKDKGSSTATVAGSGIKKGLKVYKDP